MDEKEWLDTLPEDERLKVIAEHNKTIAQLKQPIDRVQDDNDITQHSTSSYINAVYDEVKTYRVQFVDDLQATADRRLELLREIADWYEADECDYMNKRLWKRIEKELSDG